LSYSVCLRRKPDVDRTVMTTPSFLSCLPERVGPLGTVGPYALSQMEMDIFTALAGDLDPLHNDPEWAPGQAEFGGTIAAGTQSLSRLPWVLAQLGFPVRSPEVAFRARGLPRVRFISPVPVDTGVIVESELVSVEESDGASLCETKHLFRIADGSNDVLYAELTSEFKWRP